MYVLYPKNIAHLYVLYPENITHPKRFYDELAITDGQLVGANRWQIKAINPFNSWIGSCNIDLDPAICSGGRRPRSTVDGGRR